MSENDLVATDTNVATTDTISRQAAIQTAERMYRRCDTSSIEDYHDLMVDALTELPPAQLAQDLPNGCTDTISRAAALSALNGLTEIYLNNLPPTIDRADAVDAIKALPSAESELENKIRAIGYTGKEGRIYIGGRLFAVRELAQ